MPLLNYCSFRGLYPCALATSLRSPPTGLRRLLPIPLGLLLVANSSGGELKDDALDKHSSRALPPSSVGYLEALRDAKSRGDEFEEHLRSRNRARQWRYWRQKVRAANTEFRSHLAEAAKHKNTKLCTDVDASNDRIRQRYLAKLLHMASNVEARPSGANVIR